MPRVSRERIGLVLGPLTFLFLALAPPLPGVEKAALEAGVASPIYPQLALGVMLWTAIWWITECVPLGLASLIPPIIFSFSGILAWKQALMMFTHPLIWIFMGGFVIAKAFQVWGLDKRIALTLSSLYKGNNPMLATFFIACLPAFLLTITGSITASTSIVYPIVLAYLTSMGFGKGSRYAEATMLALGQAATAGAMLLLISTPPNLIAKGVIEETVKGVTITFFDWFIVGTPHAIIGLLITWVIVFVLLKPEIKELKISREKILEEKKKLGPIKKQEKIVLTIFILTLLLWMTPGIVMILASINPQYVQLSESIANILPEAAPAALAILLLGLISVEGRSILTWKEIETGIDWNVVFLFGGGLAMGSGLYKSGFSEWLVLLLTEGFALKMDLWTVTAFGAVLGFAITYPASNTASTIISAPIAATMSIAAGINPVPAVIATGLACSISSALPSTTPPMAIVYGSKYIKLWNMFKVGMVADFLRLVILLLLTPYLTMLLMQVKSIPLYLP